MRELTKPRRIITAVVLFALLAGGLLGIVTATDEPKGAFLLAAPHVGDRGVYQVNGSHPPAGSDTQATGEFRFEVRPRAATIDADGVPRIIDEVAYTDGRLPVSTNWDFPVRPALQVDAASGTPLAIVEEWTQVEEDGREVGEARTVYFLDTGTGGADALPCGLRSPLQGERLLAGLEFPLPRCMGTNHGMELHQRVEAVDADAARVSLWQTRSFGPERIGEAWYAGGIPYPVRIEMTGGPVMELTAFDPGEAPLRAPAAKEPVIPAEAPRTPWMFDETGIEHPFPASEAVQAARAHGPTGTAAFLDDNPGAYIVDTSYWEYDREDALTHEWRLTWRDADDLHHVVVMKESDSAADPVAELIANITGEEISAYSFREGNPRDLASYGPFHPPPETLPTVASMWAYYVAWARDTLPGPNMWTWTILGQDDGNRVIIHAGHFQDRPERAEDVEYSRDWAFLEYEWQDRHTPFRFSDRGFTRTAAPQATTSPDAWSLASVDGFDLDPREAGAVGAGALFVALGYYLWPLLKNGGIGLFSRLRRDVLLENPTRRSIHAYIEANPGCHYHAILRASGVSKGTLQHHLAKLAAAGLVVSAVSGGYRCHFVGGQVDRREMAAHGVLKSPVARGILAACRKEPGIRNLDLAVRLGVKPTTVSYHLGRLREQGLVHGSRGLELTETGQRVAV